MSDITSEIIVPKENANDDYVRIINWFFKQGDYVKKGDLILEIETSKANVEIAAESDGYIEILHLKGEDLPTNEIIGRIRAEKFSGLINEKIDKTMGESLKIIKEKKISVKAKLLMDKYNIDQSVFEDQDFVRETDIIKYINKTEKNIKDFIEPHESDDSKYSLFNEIRVSKKIREKSLFWVVFNYIFRNWFLNLIVKVAPVGLIIWIHRIRGVKIGKGCFIDPSAILETAYPENIQIGNDVRITAGVIIMTHIKGPIHLREKNLVPLVNKPVKINNHCFIGVGSIIMPGVTIGFGAVVASGSVVSNDVEPYVIVSGNPAKVTKNLSQS